MVKDFHISTGKIAIDSGNGYWQNDFSEGEMKAEQVTPEQSKAIERLFNRNSDGSETLEEFAKRFECYGDYVGIKWCGMFIGIEQDGYTHS